MKIAVAIPTFRRPERLAGLLAALPERVEETRRSGEFSVLVIDNDPDASARTVAEDFNALPLRYVVEPRPGIAAARNRALDEAAEANLLAFIDDDEYPRPGWLAALISVWDEHRPAAVMGRVISLFEADVDPWVLATGVFRRRPRPTGLSIPVAAAGNLLLDLDQVRALGVRFDESLGLAGGEDTLFSRQLVAHGGKILWCNESETEDPVPAERVTRHWALRRGFNGGNSAVQIDLRMAAGPTARLLVRARGLFGGLARVIGGWVRHLWGRMTGALEHDARGMRTVHRGLGMVTAAVGHIHQEYFRGGS